ncbi:MAG: beta-galactosidase [Gammaproteobacteria bacterium]
MFGVCYYPEHWPQDDWETDAAQMAALGLSFVRIGEFAWSRLEPAPGELRFDWLDKAIDVLGAAGLKVVLATPTATPPKWLVDRWPEILPVDPQTGQVRGFGSRRHYDFASEIYRNEALRITEALARRYGSNAHVAGWQTDNELCGHDTTLSASAVARRSFQFWCREQYPNINALNRAWGNVFWSMEYNDFTEVELPVGAVTETSPAHQLAYRRFSSDKVNQFHARMVATIRKYAKDQFVTHNFIPMVDTGVDNFALAEPLEFASYDSYPLGRTDNYFVEAPTEDYRRYMRTGHPDLATYYMDQTRGLSKAGFWIMEQQPGPVNWANNNPRPAPGMIRFWTLEAFAHGADCVAYFRWRQVPFAQEQMHAGLLRPDRTEATAYAEVEQAMHDVARLNLNATEGVEAKVAIVTGADGFWVSAIERQSTSYDFNDVQFDYYRALRELGVSVDFVSVDDDLTDYLLVLAPSLPIVSDAFIERCRQTDAEVVFGPRAGAKTRQFSLPANLPPGLLQSLIPLRVLSVETLRPDCTEPLLFDGGVYESRVWREELETDGGEALAQCADGPAVVQQDRFIYIGTLTCRDFLRDFLRQRCTGLGITTYEFGDDVRVHVRGALAFAFNYSEEERSLPLPDDTRFLVGSNVLGARNVAVWKA